MVYHKYRKMIGVLFLLLMAGCAQRDTELNGDLQNYRNVNHYLNEAAAPVYYNPPNQFLGVGITGQVYSSPKLAPR